MNLRYEKCTVSGHLIVRGTTCNEIIQQRDSGAKKAVFLFGCTYGEISKRVWYRYARAKSELIASDRTVEEIREIIGADRLVFQDLEDLKNAVRTSKVPNLREFECSVFDGIYVAGGIDNDYLINLEQNVMIQQKKADGYIDVNIDASSVDLTGIREE